MIQTEELAKQIEKELNGVIHTKALGLQFKIHAVEGLFKKAQRNVNGSKQAYINGILRATGGDYTPISEINNLQTNMVLEFAVPKDQAKAVELITTEWAEDVIGEIYTIGAWTYLITPTPATPGQIDDRTPLGEVIPYTSILGIQIIKNGMISNAVNWAIDGDRINVVNATFDSSRTPDTKPKLNKGYCTTTNQYETATIVLTFPYSFTTAVKSIVEDILNETWDKSYTITRKDFFAEKENAGTEEDEYLLSWECVLTKGTIIEESGKIVSITCTFARTE